MAWELDPDHHIVAWDLKNFHDFIARAACLSALAKLPAGARTCVQVNWAEVRAEMDLCASGEKLPFTSRSGGGQGDPDLDLAAAAALKPHLDKAHTTMLQHQGFRFAPQARTDCERGAPATMVGGPRRRRFFYLNAP